ncbi:glucose-6-phosphate dehydrogenase, partial [Streptomyces chartreusis]
MINHLAVLGGTGDLSARFLLPALAALRAAGHLDDGFRLTAASRQDWDSARFRQWATTQLDPHADTCPADARQAIVNAARYQRADVTDPSGVAAL